jgi:hypothetical protein
MEDMQKRLDRLGSPEPGNKQPEKKEPGTKE